MKIGDKTKQILLDEACKLFAEKGYYKTTMRNITDAANTNIAAVNYHFGGKDNLYYEAFKHAEEIENRKLEEIINRESTPKSQLKAILVLRLKGLIQNSHDSWLLQMFHHEVPNPTFLHETIVKEIMHKQRARIKILMNIFFDRDLSDAEFHLVFGCFISPILHQMGPRHKAKMYKPLFRDKIEQLEPEIRINMIATFALSGLEGLKKEFKNEK